MSDYIAGMLIGLLCGLLFAGGCVSAISQREAIKHGCAQYNQTTAQFEWKEQGK